jgi:hypothetical protein
VQVLMWNPTVFPGQPEQFSTGLLVQILPGGDVVTAPYGTPVGGIDIWAEVSINAQGQKVLRFPFSIDGL